VTRGQLPQTAGPLGLNGGGAAAMVPPKSTEEKSYKGKTRKHKQQ